MLKYDCYTEKIWREAGFDVTTPQECADDFNDVVIDSNGNRFYPEHLRNRCADCPYLVAGNNGEWVCDCRRREIQFVDDEECPAENEEMFTCLEA